MDINRFQGIIFDMDGLMIDSEPLQLKALNEALGSPGITVAETDFIPMIGLKSSENFRALKDKYGLRESVEILERKKNRAYHRIIRRELKPMPGLFQVIAACKKRDLALAIASSSRKADVDMVLKILGLSRSHTFSIIVSGDQVEKGKPDPGIFLKAARMMGREPGRLMVLEDTDRGVTAAKAAGMYCIAIPNRFTLHHDLSNADMVLNSLLDLLPYVSAPR